jgi:hypothetical protein
MNDLVNEKEKFNKLFNSKSSQTKAMCNDIECTYNSRDKEVCKEMDSIDHQSPVYDK